LEDVERLDFSFSGLKTAVRYQITGPGRADFSGVKIDPQRVADLAASFQEAVVDCLIGKAVLAMKQSGLPTLCVGGGVAANARLRERLDTEKKQHGYDVLIAPLPLCLDNAVMGAIAIERLRAGLSDGLEIDVLPGLVRRNPKVAQYSAELITD
jgi:N6-L-threonylcarbamoyladenine synthase